MLDIKSDDTISLCSTVFRTRARTADHLGRDQIADCPTAVSELWKNAWDAYARNVVLRVHAGDTPVILLADDGHGMSPEEFFEKWLVIGTESKASSLDVVAAEDRNGLPIRPRQGQKGIGRLSSARLGSILLLVSRRKTGNLLGALIDWRLFENPYVNLEDVPVAAGEFSGLDELFDSMEEMADTLAAGIIDTDIVKDWRSTEQDLQLRASWRRFDQDWNNTCPDKSIHTPSARSLEPLKRLPFSPEHLAEWSGTGMAMLVSEIDDALRVLAVSSDTDVAAQGARDRFEQTLASFVDPYAEGVDQPEFNYRIDIAGDESMKTTSRLIVGNAKGIDRACISGMEHRIEGTVDEHGTFRGRIKAFGDMIDDVVMFRPPADFRVSDHADFCVSNHADSKVGPFDIFMSTMEWENNSSTHLAAQHRIYQELASDHGGLMIFRDGLRVLPYGREDNDFFGIEKRRSRNAGRYFWNHRRMFGRIALKRQDNPNLNDKAGREGFIENAATRAFREIVINVLDTAARKYFGSDSDLRKERLPEIQNNNQQIAVSESEKIFRERECRVFQGEIERAEVILPELIEDTKKAIDSLVFSRDKDVVDAETRLVGMRIRLEEARVQTHSEPAGRWAARYDRVQNRTGIAAVAIDEYQARIASAVEEFKPVDPDEVLRERTEVASRTMRKQVGDMRNHVEELQRDQNRDVRQLADTRLSSLEDDLEIVIQRYFGELVTFEEALDSISRREMDWLAESQAVFSFYESALESVRERIDLKTLASVRMRELGDANREVEQLNALAQLGIAVEIAGHDLADYDETISQGLGRLPNEIQDSQAARDIRLGMKGLTDHLRFLSPLRLSGEKVQRWITGEEIETFVGAFFMSSFMRAKIEFEVSPQFRAVRLFERPSRIFPVFINLVNNAIYWTATQPQADRRIQFELMNDQVVVADTGPGVNAEDAERIFDLFFTLGQRGGRGVGLYLARTNLAAGGHTIRYRSDGDQISLEGAGFVIGFRGLETPEE